VGKMKKFKKLVLYDLKPKPIEKEFLEGKPQNKIV